MANIMKLPEVLTYTKEDEKEALNCYDDEIIDYIKKIQCYRIYSPGNIKILKRNSP